MRTFRDLTFGFRTISLFLVFFAAFPFPARAQSGGSIRGRVTLESSATPVERAIVTILQLKRSVVTDADGNFTFANVPAGTYDVFAHLDWVPDLVKRVEVGGGEAEVDFALKLRAESEQVVVTATGGEETSTSSIQSVTTVSALDLAQRAPVSLGEALDREPGIAKRAFGPGNSRPVIRGFDGDRVLVTQDGISIGSLGFQSGDHGEPIDVQGLEKIEVVKGPATLLYGGTAIGGVVNAISGNDEQHPGLQGYFTALGGSANGQAGVSGGIKYGRGNWMFFANGGGQRTGDFETPSGTVTNSFSRSGNASGGLGYYRSKGFMTFTYRRSNNNYGIPADVREEEPETVRINPTLNSFKIAGGLRDLDGFFTGAQFQVQINRYKHGEFDVPTGALGTEFINNTVFYRAMADHRRIGKFTGTFGVSGLHRDYVSTGEEALAPPTTLNNFAFFGLEKVNFDRVTFQFGGRVERNSYNPTGLRSRTFTGFSGGAGARVGLWENGSFVANYTHTYRAPALEELYNNGPHPGNLLFEIGDQNLNRERADGIDVSVRHSSRRVRAEAGIYYYNIRDFVFPAVTGEFEDGLPVAFFRQGDVRFVGTEAKLDVNLHPNLWLYTSLDYVNAELKTGTPLPRIPPVRGRISLEGTYKGFRLAPELLLAGRQDRVFTLETPTAGYAVFNVTGSYTFTSRRSAHVVSVTGFNLGDRLYRNHLSFIKDFAPEIGRGVRASYTIRFF